MTRPGNSFSRAFLRFRGEKLLETKGDICTLQFHRGGVGQWSCVYFRLIFARIYSGITEDLDLPNKESNLQYYNLSSFKVGQPYQGAVPIKDGQRLEIARDGLPHLIIQCQQPTSAEVESYKSGFGRYSYFEAVGNVTLATWVFKYPAPVGYLDAPFNAALYKDNRIRHYLNNDYDVLVVCVLDGKILRDFKLCRLEHNSVRLFKETINRQLTEDVSMSSYNTAVDRLFRMSPEQIYRSGKNYICREVSPEKKLNDCSIEEI